MSFIELVRKFGRREMRAWANLSDGNPKKRRSPCQIGTGPGLVHSHVRPQQNGGLRLRYCPGAGLTTRMSSI